MPKTFHRMQTARRGIENPINLKQTRRWFAEGEAGDQQNQQDNSKQPDGKYSPTSLEDALKIISALTKRVEEREEEAKRFKSERDGLTAAQRKQLEEQGNYKTLAEQHAAEIARLKPFEEQATVYGQIIRSSNDARIKEIPEQYRTMIPKDYSPEKLQEWLNANAALLVKQPAPSYDAGAGANGGGARQPELSASEMDIAKRMGLTAQQYKDAKKAAGLSN